MKISGTARRGALRGVQTRKTRAMSTAATASSPAQQHAMRAAIGALLIGAAEVLSIQYIDPLLSDVVPFLVLIAALVVRPWGLLGTREELDRV